MKPRFIYTTEQFSRSTQALRRVFENRFQNPLSASPERFIWDHWHVPGQYTLLRTPAEAFFPPKLLTPLLQQLTLWGQKNLGCMNISPPWLSCYVEGCEQKFHCDVPHGPWAFVLSLTQHHNKDFVGGETQIIRPERLSFWQNFESSRGLEEPDLFKTISPKFNRLIVFDPRLPHAVTPVRGTSDVRRGRLVLHGWFTHPQPILYGPVSPKEFQTQLKKLLLELESALGHFAPLTGTVCYNFSISSRGEIASLRLLSHTLVPRFGAQATIQPLLKWLNEHMFSLRFSRSSAKRQVTLPLIFD